MWSKPLLWRFRQSKEIPQTQVSQGFAAFHIAPPGYRHGTPKPRALPSELHPVMKNVLGSKQSVLPAKPEISIAEAPQKSKTGGSALFAFGVKAVAIFPRSCYNDREVAFLHEGGVSNG